MPMANNDHVSDLLARLRNAQQARFEQMEIPSTNILQGITQILKEEGFIKGYRLVTEKNTSRLRIALKSTPGLPVPEFALTRFVVNEVRLQGSRCGPFDKAIRFQAAHRLPLRALVVDTFDLPELDRAMGAASSAAGKVAIRVDTARA